MDKQEEDKLEFTREGESLGYISLDQARVLAMEHARDNREPYGRRYRSQQLVWDVLEAVDDGEYYSVRLSFRPSGRFQGTPGSEQFVIGKLGEVRLRQVLDSPSARSAPVALLLMGAIILASAITGALYALGVFDMGRQPPAAANVPLAGTPFLEPPSTSADIVDPSIDEVSMVAVPTTAPQLSDQDIQQLIAQALANSPGDRDQVADAVNQLVQEALINVEEPTLIPTLDPTPTPFPTLVPTLPPTPAPTLKAVPPTATVLPTPTPRPTARPTPVAADQPAPSAVAPTLTPLPERRLFINNIHVQSNNKRMTVDGGTVTLSLAPGSDGVYSDKATVTMVANGEPGWQVIWDGVDSENGVFGTVQMATDRHVILRFAPPPTPAPEATNNSIDVKSWWPTSGSCLHRGEHVVITVVYSTTETSGIRIESSPRATGDDVVLPWGKGFSDRRVIVPEDNWRVNNIPLIMYSADKTRQLFETSVPVRYRCR